MKTILIISLLFLSLSCSDEPQISKAPEGAKMITYEEAVTKGYTETQPVCQGGICCWQGGGGAVCWRDPR